MSDSFLFVIMIYFFIYIFQNISCGFSCEVSFCETFGEEKTLTVVWSANWGQIRSKP